MHASRRRFLRGLGGAAVAAPFLGSLGAGAVRAQAEERRRLIVMFTHYGCMTNWWFPQSSHGPLGAADYAGTSLEVLAPHASKLLMPRGIRAMNEWNPQLIRGQGNDLHTQVVGSYFTCAPVTPHSDDPFRFDAAYKFQAMPTAASLDHVCAEQLHADGLPLLINVARRNDSPQSAISYSAPETPFMGKTAAQALSALTGLFTDDAPTSPDTYQAVRGQSVVDLVRDDLATLERYDMSAADRQKLEAWKALLDDTTRAVTSMMCNADTAELLQLTAENAEAAPATGTDLLTTEIAPGLDYADLNSNIAVLAALCDQSRVTFLKYPGNYVFSGLGITSESAGLSTRLGNAGMLGPCAPDVNAQLRTIDEYYAAKFAHLVAQMDGFAEADGTLLDASAVVWFQEFSDGAASNLNNLPILQAGSCGGYFKTGHAVNVDDGSADLHRGNSVAPCAEDGEIATIGVTGTPPEFGNAPINKYYCNLMNAIGVKAGADGFPAVGGTEEVTRYGTYDRTEDFVSGGELPPTIHDPGEFSALRA